MFLVMIQFHKCFCLLLVIDQELKLAFENYVKFFAWFALMHHKLIRLEALYPAILQELDVESVRHILLRKLFHPLESL